MDELFEIERTINGKSPAERVAARREHSNSLVEVLDTCLQEQRTRISTKDGLATAINTAPAAGRLLPDSSTTDVFV